MDRELQAISASLEGFEGQTLVVVGRWASREAAAAGAATIGRGAFGIADRPAEA